MPSVHATFLGTGDAFSAGGKHQAGYLVQAEGSTLLLDCGATTLKAMKVHGIDPMQVDTVLLSHLHGDHFAGLPFLFLQYTYETVRRRPLHIAGPPGTEERVRALFAAMYKSTAGKPLPFALRFTEMQPGTALDLGAARIEPFAVPHQENEISLALRVGLAERKILYSGDTGWTEDLIGMADGTDLFICECSYFETRIDSHLDYPRLHDNRSSFGSRRMILTHLGREVLARRNEVEIELASDGLEVDL